MGQSDDIEDSLFTKHQELCRRLNLDTSMAMESWKSYENIRQHYTLEGDQLQWIGCALYVACRKAILPTVGKTGSNTQGNGVSLTQLLHFYNLPLIEFFNKSKAWADMGNMPQDFGARIDMLQKNFSVSSVIFQKYKPIFKDIFKYSADDFINPPRSRRHNKSVPCTPSRLFEFGWSLFICLKSRISSISDDLVNSYHLLVVCCDLLYSNALLANRKDLLNPDFYGLPENFNDDDFIPPSKANCIVSLLCEHHNAVPVEAIGIKEYYLKRTMTKLFNDKVIKGNAFNITGIIETPNFEGNLKALNRAYERHVLSVGDLDERIFLDSDSNNSIGSSPTKIANHSNLQGQVQPKKELGGINHLGPPTPLTGRKYLKTKDVTANAAPTLHPTQSVIRLNTLLVGCQSVPSENLRKIFENSSPELQPFIDSKIEEFGKMFYNEYIQSSKESEDTENSGFDFGKKRLQSAQTLFYKILELVLTDEISKKPDVDVSVLLKNVNFIQCLFACCCEIVIYSYQNQDKTFPWILKALNLKAYNFFRVIEITIKVCFNQLTRNTVKYLNRIEETILESLAWESTSPFWDAIKGCEGVPSYQDVALPGTFDIVDPTTPGPNSVSESFQSPNPSAPRRTGSLALFFRKFYHMTVMRMQSLCAELQITEDDLKRKIWTIFECSIMKRTHLMKDRHLDQILVCAVYVICKLCRTEKNTFAEIVEFYRKQPQAASHIYRSVLISKIQNDSESALQNGNGETKLGKNSPPTPSEMAATSHIFGSEERGDLIKFYNTVYVPEVKSFAEKFGASRGGNIANLMLSPLPTPRPASKVSAVRRVTDSVMTRVLDPKEIVASPAPRLHYCFSRSPSKNLETINKMMTEIVTKKGVGKRLLADEAEIPGTEANDDSTCKKARTTTATTFVSKKLENIIDDRRTQNN